MSVKTNGYHHEFEQLNGKTNGYQSCDLVSMDEDDFEEINIPVPWGHIAGKWWGPRNVQPVIAIHGWQDNAGSFDRLAPILRDRGISVFCIDLPGHGLSSHYPKGQYYYIFWDGLHFLRRIVKHFNWQRITILGHSLGGAIAFLYAAVYPEDVDRYISIDIASPSVRDPIKMMSVVGDSVDKFLGYENLPSDKSPSYDYHEMVDLVHDAYKGSVSKSSCEIMMKRGMQPRGNGKYKFSRDVRLKVSALAFMTIDQVLLHAKCIKCKVMNIRGDPGMVFEKAEYYDMVLDKISEHAEVVERHVVAGTHHLHLNNAASIAGIIVQFLKS